MKILVTGAAGFIGSNIALELEKQGHEVYALDNFYNSDFRNLIGLKGEIIYGDITDREIYTGLPVVDAVVHQAAITDTTIMDQAFMMRVNVEGTRLLLDYAKRIKARFVYASSAAQYGNGPVPMKESQKRMPENIYGFSKYAMDNLCMQYSSDINVIGLRYFNVYGPREQHKGGPASMVFHLALQMMDGKRPRVFRAGQHERDFVYVRDVVRANLLSLDYEGSGVFNIGSGRAESFNTLIGFINESLGTDYPPEYFENPYPFYQNKTEADISLAKKELGYTPRYPLKKGVEDYIAWLRNPPFRVEEKRAEHK